MRSVTTTLRDFFHQNTDATIVDLVTVTLATATVFRWTNHSQDITTGGFTWTAGGTGTAPILGRGKVRDAVGLDSSDLDLTLWCGTSAELGSSVKLQAAAVNGLLDGARVKLERCYLDSALAVIGTLVRFEGQVSDVTINSTSVELKTRSDLESLNTPLPRNLYKPLCLHAVFDAGCGLSRAAFTVTGTVQSGSTTLVINHLLGSATNYYAGGAITITSGALSGVTRTITASTSTTFTLEYPIPSAVAGVTFSAYPGCDKKASTCHSKYLNLPRRRGFDFVPTADAVNINPTAEYQTDQRGGRQISGSTASFKGDKTGQTSSYGKPIPIVYGQQRIPAMVALAGLYTNGLSGYGAMSVNLVQLALCEGPITGVVSIWLEKTKYTPGGLGVTVQTGAGVNAYSAGTTYGKGEWVSSAGTNYVSLQAGNLNKTPASNPTWWAARGVAATERAQSPWSYMTTTWPALALGYGGTAMVSTSTTWGTTSDGALKRATFEVSGLLSGSAWFGGSVSGLAGPPMVITSILTNTEFGLGWNTSKIDNYSTGSGYPSGFSLGLDGTAASSYDYLVRANSWGLGLSIDTQRPARDIILEILKATDSTSVWSGGVLKVLPLSTTSVSDGVVTFTPCLTPVYDLGYSADGADMLADGGDDPVQVERAPLKDHFNCYPVEWSNQSPIRTDINGTVISEPSNAYNADTEEGTPDPADVALYGIRKAETTSLRCIVNKQHATDISNALARRSVESRNTYRFRLPWRFALCEPGDLVTITDAKLGVSRQLVRIKEIEEDENGIFDVVSEDVGTVPVAAAATYTLS